MKSRAVPPKLGHAAPVLVALAAGTSFTLFVRPSHADQFVLFDATFSYTWEDANNSTPSKSHYYVNEDNFLNQDRPDNWQSTVNYRDGSVHIRAEVLEKPEGDQQVGWALCYIANAGGYGCAYTDYYASTGVYERNVDMHGFWNNETIDWTQGIKQVDLVYTINDSGSGHVHNFPGLQSETTPTKVRITMVQVSEGDTYDSSILGASGGSGGLGGAGSSGAAGTAGAGGSTAGASGTGGVAGSTPTTPPPATAGASGGGGSAGAPAMAPTRMPRKSADNASCSLHQRSERAGGAPWLVLAGVVGAFSTMRGRRRSR